MQEVINGRFDLLRKPLTAEQVADRINAILSAGRDAA
jgi:hypothetical protein